MKIESLLKEVKLEDTKLKDIYIKLIENLKKTTIKYGKKESEITNPMHIKHSDIEQGVCAGLTAVQMQQISSCHAKSAYELTTFSKDE